MDCFDAMIYSITSWCNYFIRKLTAYAIFGLFYLIKLSFEKVM